MGRALGWTLAGHQCAPAPTLAHQLAVQWAVLVLAEPAGASASPCVSELTGRGPSAQAWSPPLEPSGLLLPAPRLAVTSEPQQAGQRDSGPARYLLVCSARQPLVCLSASPLLRSVLAVA